MDYSIYYNQWHNNTNEHINNMKQYYKEILNTYLCPSFLENKKLNILEIGCGKGYTLLTLKDLGFTNIKGIDIDQKQIESSNEKGLNVIHIIDTIEFLQSSNEKYDLIIMFDVLEHIKKEKQQTFLKAIQQSMNKNSILLLSVPNADSIVSSRYRYVDWTHEISFTKESLHFILYNSGFKSNSIFINPLENKFQITIKNFISFNTIKLVISKIFRLIHRLKLLGEFGYSDAKNMYLSVNLIATIKNNY